MRGEERSGEGEGGGHRQFRKQGIRQESTKENVMAQKGRGAVVHASLPFRWASLMSIRNQTCNAHKQTHAHTLHCTPQIQKDGEQDHERITIVRQTADVI